MRDLTKTKWYKTRPQSVKDRIDHYPPGGLYKMRSTNHKVLLYSYGEDSNGECSTCTVIVLKKYNPQIQIERRVFGIPFNDLVRIDN